MQRLINNNNLKLFFKNQIIQNPFSQSIIARRSLELFHINKKHFHTTTKILANYQPEPAKKFIFRDFKKFLSLARPHRWILAGAMFCLGLNAATNLLVPYCMGKSIDTIVNPEKAQNMDKAEARQQLLHVAGVLSAGKIIILF